MTDAGHLFISQSQAPTATPGSAVSVRAVSKSFSRDISAPPVLQDVSFDIPPGQFVSLLGPSGCGKSTLLRMIAGLDRPTRGSVDIESHFVSSPHEARPRSISPIAYVFQDPHLLPWRNVLGNVALPLELAGVHKGARQQSAEQTIALVGLADAIRKYPAQLSGGMRMRVSLARALVTRPRLLLLDEPFAALDELTRHTLDAELRSLWLAQRMTVLFVTHSTHEAAFLSERTLVMGSRPGRIVRDQMLDLPASRDDSLRGEAHFAATVKMLFDGLASAGQVASDSPLTAGAR